MMPFASLSVANEDESKSANNLKQNETTITKIKTKRNTMSTQNPRVEEVKQVMNDLIQIATSYDIDELDRIYHDDMSVLMIDTEGSVNTANKADFIQIFQAKKDAGEPPMNTWADFHRIDVDGDKAHVLVSRKNDLSGQNMILLLSIDFIFQDNRWQVTREVIFLRPEE